MDGSAAAEHATFGTLTTDGCILNTVSGSLLQPQRYWSPFGGLSTETNDYICKLLQLCAQYRDFSIESSDTPNIFCKKNCRGRLLRKWHVKAHAANHGNPRQNPLGLCVAATGQKHHERRQISDKTSDSSFKPIFSSKTYT